MHRAAGVLGIQSGMPDTLDKAGQRSSSVSSGSLTRVLRESRIRQAGGESMKRSVLPILSLCAGAVVMSAAAAAAATGHHHHAYYGPYAVYGPCQTFHYQVITFRNARLARAGLQPQAYCGVPRQANPSDQTNSSGGGLNEIR